jgi:hypothetical protein
MMPIMTILRTLSSAHSLTSKNPASRVKKTLKPGQKSGSVVKKRQSAKKIIRKTNSLARAAVMPKKKYYVVVRDFPTQKEALDYAQSFADKYAFRVSVLTGE